MSIDYSPTWFRAMRAVGVLLFGGLLTIAWTSDTAQVGLDIGFKLELSVAALVLGVGLWMYAGQYRARAHAEARMRASVMRNLEVPSAATSPTEAAESRAT